MGHEAGHNLKRCSPVALEVAWLHCNVLQVGGLPNLWSPTINILSCFTGPNIRPKCDFYVVLLPLHREVAYAIWRSSMQLVPLGENVRLHVLALLCSPLPALH